MILQPTDWSGAGNASQLLAAALQKIGVNAELAPSDWGGVVTRRANKGPIADGGWNIFISAEPDYSLGNPLTDPILIANGDMSNAGVNERAHSIRTEPRNGSKDVRG
ncbi:hypothetical protein MesoLj113a_72660 [Mesorhizobium sp. 113-1-2]|nr:hypothetical protein MesoLj113a_72660 [Mesorhizobium sp. 113-1-2]